MYIVHDLGVTTNVDWFELGHGESTKFPLLGLKETSV